MNNGWRIRFYQNWNWADGPGQFISGTDLQAVGCHEYGHALGLGHSTVGSSTIMMAGLPINVWAIPRRRFIPPESLLARRSRTSNRPTCSSNSSTRSRRSRLRRSPARAPP
ncbi:MAG TPA: matrixin family metalloprotease [Dehalococcoidia bacterium]|nr:matrixin family metalloprotease [Dehalococcoidia bacterium]